MGVTKTDGGWVWPMGLLTFPNPGSELPAGFPHPLGKTASTFWLGSCQAVGKTPFSGLTKDSSGLA